MKTFINHMILFIYCILIAVFNKNFSIFSVTSVIALLASVIITNMSFFFHNKKFTASASGIYVIISLFIPEFALMLPALSYDIMEFSGYPLHCRKSQGDTCGSERWIRTSCLTLRTQAHRGRCSLPHRALRGYSYLHRRA